MTIEKEKGMKKINNSLLEIARKPHNEFLKYQGPQGLLCNKKKICWYLGYNL